MKAVIVICIIVFFVRLILFFRKANPLNTTDRIIAFTGTLGSGKTFHAVEIAIKKLKLFPKKKRGDLITNFPIINKKNYAFKLIDDILDGKVRIKENSIIVIDEIGAYINKYQFREQQLKGLFFRLARQFANVYIICTEQRLADIPITLRAKIATIYCLGNCKSKYLGRVLSSEVREVSIQEGVYSVVNPEVGYTALFIPFKKRYDSRMYSLTYEQLDFAVLEKWDSLKMPLDCYKNMKAEIYKGKNKKPVQAKKTGENGEIKKEEAKT